MTEYTLDKLRDGYAALWKGMTINPQRMRELNRDCGEIITFKPRYQVVERLTGVPWFVVGIIHCLEGGFRWSTHLSDGSSPLTGRTIYEPKGLYTDIAPPYTWENGARLALRQAGLDKIKMADVPTMCWALEKYNGFGYRGKGVNTPYLWSYSNQYRAGKYVKDNVWSPGAVSEQCGAMPLLHRLAELDTSIFGTDEAYPPPPAKTVPVAPFEPALASKPAVPHPAAVEAVEVALASPKDIEKVVPVAPYVPPPPVDWMALVIEWLEAVASGR